MDPDQVIGLNGLVEDGGRRSIGVGRDDAGGPGGIRPQFSTSVLTATSMPGNQPAPADAEPCVASVIPLAASVAPPTTPAARARKVRRVNCVEPCMKVSSSCSTCATDDIPSEGGSSNFAGLLDCWVFPVFSNASHSKSLRDDCGLHIRAGWMHVLARIGNGQRARRPIAYVMRMVDHAVVVVAAAEWT